MIARKRRAGKPTMNVGDKAHPGLELDARGRPIPMAQRLPEDREKVRRATKRKKATKRKT